MATPKLIISEEAAVERELDLIFDAYYEYRTENDGKRPMRDNDYYQDAEHWALKQGVDIDVFSNKVGRDTVIWESESRKVEFLLRWMK